MEKKSFYLLLFLFTFLYFVDIIFLRFYSYLIKLTTSKKQKYHQMCFVSEMQKIKMLYCTIATLLLTLQSINLGFRKHSFKTQMLHIFFLFDKNLERKKKSEREKY